MNKNKEIIFKMMSSALLSISLPAAATHDLRARSRLGQVSVNGLNGSRLLAESDPDDVQTAGDWSQASLTSNLGDLVYSGAAFDLFMQTQLGNAVIAVGGTQPMGSPGAQQAHYRSPNFESSGRQVRVNAGSSLGSILIHD